MVWLSVIFSRAAAANPFWQEGFTANTHGITIRLLTPITLYLYRLDP